MKLSSVKEAQEHDEGMERQKIECEEKTDELKVSHKSALDSNEGHIRTLVTAHNHETANLTITFTEELLEQTEMKTALEKNLEGSEELVAFLLTVLEESKDTMSELEGLITDQGNKIQEVIIDHEGFREKEKSFYKSVRNSTSASKDLLRKFVQNSENIISFNEALNRTHLRVKALELNDTKCDIPTYLTEGLLTQEKEFREYKDWAKVDVNIEDLLNQVVEELARQDKSLNMTELSWDMMTKCQGMVEKQSTSLAQMRDLMSYTMERTPALRYNHNDEDQLISATACQCLPQPPENITTVFLEVSQNEGKWAPMWTEWTYTNCQPLSPNSTENCGDGTKKRTRLASLDELIWNEEEEEVACFPCPGNIIYIKYFISTNLTHLSTLQVLAKIDNMLGTLRQFRPIQTILDHISLCWSVLVWSSHVAWSTIGVLKPPGLKKISLSLISDLNA